MSLMVLAAQAASKRKYTEADADLIFKNLPNTFASEESSPIDITSVFDKCDEISKKAHLNKEYDYKDAYVVKDGSLIDPFEKYAIEFYKGKGPIESQISGPDIFIITKIFNKLMRKKEKDVDAAFYRHPDFIEHWVRHLEFYKKGTEFSNYLKTCKKPLTEKQLQKAKRFFEILPKDAKKKYALVVDQEAKTALHWAADISEGLSEFILKLFDEDERANYASIKDKSGNTAFHKALQSNTNLDKLADIIPPKDLADVLTTTKMDSKDTVFHIAARKEKIDEILSLLKKLPNIEDVKKCILAKNSEGDNFLCVSTKIKFNDIALKTLRSEFGLSRFVDHLINKLPDLKDLIIDIQKKSSFDIEKFCEEISKTENYYLIDEVNRLFSKFKRTRLESLIAKNSQNDTILHLAVKNKDLSLTQEIMKAKQAVLEKDSLGFTPLEIALIIMRKDLIEEILKSFHSCEIKALNLAIIEGSENEIEKILTSIPQYLRAREILKKDATGLSALELSFCKLQRNNILKIFFKVLPEKDRQKLEDIIKSLNLKKFDEKLKQVRIANLRANASVFFSEFVKDFSNINDDFISQNFLLLILYIISISDSSVDKKTLFLANFSSIFAAMLEPILIALGINDVGMIGKVKNMHFRLNESKIALITFLYLSHILRSLPFLYNILLSRENHKVT